MSIYSINFPDLSNKLNVPILRKPKLTAFLNVLANQLTWNHNRFFTDYANGSVYADYNSLTAYVFGDIVLYRDSLNNKKVYLCIANTSTGVSPTDTTNWLLLFDDFVGSSERVLWTNQKLMLEYILNKYFDGVFNQPPTPSDIYITNATTSQMFPVWSEPTAWASGTTYALNATVKYNGRYWISLQAGNLNKIPDQQSVWWDSDPDVFTRYISTTAYPAAKIVRYSYFHFISLQATTGNAPPTAGGSNAYWKQLKNIWYYEPFRSYNAGDVVDYNSGVYMCISPISGTAPPNVTYWTPVVNGHGYTSETGIAGVDNCGFNINIPAGMYSNLGGNFSHPNKADESIYRIVRKFWSGVQFRIITY